jgi:hypothetical protein
MTDTDKSKYKVAVARALTHLTRQLFAVTAGRCRIGYGRVGVGALTPAPTRAVPG